MLTIEQVDELCAAKRAYQRIYDLTIHDVDAAAEEGPVYLCVADVHKLRDIAAACGATVTRRDLLIFFDYGDVRFYNFEPEEGSAGANRD